MLAQVLRRNLKQAIDRRDAADVASLLARLAEVEPNAVETQLLALEWLLAQRRLAEARTLANSLVEQFPDRPRAHELLGRTAVLQLDYEPALAAFVAADRLAPAPRLRHWIGRVHLRRSEFDAAEPILRAIGPAARMDLAWLHERRGELALARDLVDKHLADHPGDGFAQGVRQRLAAAALGRDEVLEEVAALQGLGEAVAPALVEPALRHLLESGRSAEARELLAPHLPGLSEANASRWGWVAYKAVAYDLAFDLFVRAFRRNRADPKFLNSLEKAARSAGQVEALRELYAAHAAEVPALYGRSKRLAR